MAIKEMVNFTVQSRTLSPQTKKFFELPDSKTKQNVRNLK